MSTPEQLCQQAASDWFMKLEEGLMDKNEDAHFQEWLNADPAHEQAFVKTQMLWGLSGELRQDSDIAAMISKCKTIDRRPGISKYFTFLKHAKSLVAVATMLTITLAGLLYILGNKNLYETAVGEQRNVILADGSTIMLNTNSAVKVKYNEKNRDIYLQKGEVFFSVKPDKARPFRVHAGESYVRAVGTRFSVQLTGKNENRVTVSVLEGIVEVATAKFPKAAEKPRLTLGQALSYDKTHSDSITTTNIAVANTQRIEGWRTGQFVFQNLNLAEVVRDHNRYSKIKIRLNDTALANETISGRFEIGDTNALLFALKNLLNIDVRNDGETITIKKRPTMGSSAVLIRLGLLLPLTA